MIGSPKIHTGFSREACDATRATRPRSALLAFGLGSKPSLSRRILVVAARLRRTTNGAVANAMAKHASVVLRAEQHHCEQSPVTGRSISYSPLDQLIAWAVARLGRGGFA